MNFLQIGLLAKKLHIFSIGNSAPKLSLPGKLVFPRLELASLTMKCNSMSIECCFIFEMVGHSGLMFLFYNL